MIKYVQFKDVEQTVVCAVFGCDQDATAYPNQGQIDATDARYQLFINPASTLSGAQADALAALATEFAQKSAADVTDSNGVAWSGGLQSALSIDGAARLAAAGGATTIEIFDASNAGHVLTIVQANAVSTAIGAAYQTAFAKYQGYKVAIAAATTVKAVQAITWE